MNSLTITTTCSVGPDGPEETVWCSLNGTDFIPTSGLGDWREWTHVPSEVMEAIRELFTPERDEATGVTRYTITWNRRLLEMDECEFVTIEGDHGY